MTIIATKYVLKVLMTPAVEGFVIVKILVGLIAHVSTLFPTKNKRVANKHHPRDRNVAWL